jgi:hypothetical protein
MRATPHPQLDQKVLRRSVEPAAVSGLTAKVEQSLSSARTTNVTEARIPKRPLSSS